jgi:ATP-dependent DNA helicase RecG
MDLSDSIAAIRGIGPKKAQRLSNIGIFTVEDLLTYFPRGYQDRREVTPLADLQNGIPALTCGKVLMVVKESTRYKKQQILRVLVEDSLSGDEVATMEVVFFHVNYLENQFKKGEDYYFYGTPKIEWGKRQMIFPEFFPEHSPQANMEARTILPLYPLTYGISQTELRKWVRAAFEPPCAFPEYLPKEVLNDSRLCCLDYAMHKIHFPHEKDELKAAKYRLIFDELYLLQLGLMLLAQQNKSGQQGLQMIGDAKPLIERLPYRLTDAQDRIMHEIFSDMVSGNRMNRLIQGDVGSGKTVLAALALYKAVISGYQGVLMAPTELLASQHEKTLRSLFQGLSGPAQRDIKIALLTGGMKPAAKRVLLEQLSAGDLDIVIGTHALIQPSVEFHKLGLVVTDEQHRFGVEQRMHLNEKGHTPHILVLTATPIPRTLAVVLFGDMDISKLDEKPAGRRGIITKVSDQLNRAEVYRLVEQELKRGQQAFVVTPLIEESETLDIKSTEEVYAQLKNEFRNYRVACLHGGMQRNEKDSIMLDFASGNIDLLVSTVVIEVGIDIPNATIMVIENAERFGLAQLHQLRGRVGRGQEQSYCILISDGKSEYAKKRAEIMTSSSDGFYIAEKDLELRGPGEFFGTRQHGLPELKLADLVRHIKIFEEAKMRAASTLETDPDLSGFPILQEKAKRLFERGLNL